MRYVDLSYEGRQLAERSQQLNNGKLPHGGYKGSRRHPISPVSFAKGEEFQRKLGQEIEKMLWEEELMLHGSSPAWSLLVHKQPSYTDESPLMTNNYLAASKLEQRHGENINNQTSATGKCGKPVKSNHRIYYRPNSTHQFLSATDLKNCTENEVNVQHGRPTRATLLRNLQRRNSASSIYSARKDFLHRLYDIRNSSQLCLDPQSLKVETVPDRESLHSFLTGTRYNRYNPTLGCYFTELKGHAPLQEPDESQAYTEAHDKGKQRPLLISQHRFRPATVPARKPNNAWREQKLAQSALHYQTTFLKLNVIGNQLPVRHSSDKLPSLHTSKNILERQSKFTVEDPYRAHRYSSVSSVKSDSDEQGISESVKNAIISSNTELPAEGAEKSSSTSILKSEAEVSINEISKSSDKIPFINAPPFNEQLISLPSVVAQSTSKHDEINEEAGQTSIIDNACGQETLDSLYNSNGKDERGVQYHVLEEDNIGNDDIDTINDELDNERGDTHFNNNDVVIEEQADTEADDPVGNDDILSNNETIQETKSTNMFDDTSEDNKDLIITLGEGEEDLNDEKLSDSEVDDVKVDEKQGYQVVRFFITEESTQPGSVVEGHKHNQTENKDTQDT